MPMMKNHKVRKGRIDKKYRPYSQENSVPCKRNFTTPFTDLEKE